MAASSKRTSSNKGSEKSFDPENISSSSFDPDVDSLQTSKRELEAGGGGLSHSQLQSHIASHPSDEQNHTAAYAAKQHPTVKHNAKAGDGIQQVLSHLESAVAELHTTMSVELENIKGLFQQHATRSSSTRRQQQVLRETTLEQTILPSIIEFVKDSEQKHTGKEPKKVETYLKEIKSYLEYIWEIQKGITSGQHAQLVSQLINERNEWMAKYEALQRKHQK